MLLFEQEFFEEEERCGFVVPKMMKHAWAAQLEVLSLIIGVCGKYGLTYYADWGTLLGAVRHQGFVPWDDDVDIALGRRDYMKLLEVLPGELPEHFHISSLYTEGDHKQPISCVMNAAKLPLEGRVIEEFHGCPYIVGVDVYPLDYIPRDEEAAKCQLSLYNVVYDLAQRFVQIEKDGELEKYLVQVEELCAVKLRRDRYLRKQLWRLSDRIASMFTEDESDELTWFPRRVKGDLKYRLKKEWYSGTYVRDFENIELAIPCGYDEILTLKYGDYMKPVNRRGGHEYPFYRRQEEYLKSKGIQ